MHGTKKRNSESGPHVRTCVSASVCLSRGDGRRASQSGQVTISVLLRAGIGEPILKTLHLGEGTHLLEARRNPCLWGKWGTGRDLVTGDLGTGRTAHLSERARGSRDQAPQCGCHHGGSVAPVGSRALEAKGLPCAQADLSLEV